MKLIGSVLALLLGASASLFAFEYEIKTVKVLPIESYPARVSVDGVTIAADPYSTDQKSYSAFDIKDLNTRGYHPIHLVIRNDSEKFLSLRTRNVLLITSEGAQLYSTPATVLVEDVVKSAPQRPFSDFSSKELVQLTVEPGATVDGFLFFYASDSEKNLFAGSTLFIPKLEEEGTRRPVGPFSISLDPAMDSVSRRVRAPR